jgi:hypothetical protein
MKKSLLIVAATVMSSLGAFAQGYVDFSFATHRVWDEFTTPGVGVYAGNVQFAVYWAPTATTDPLVAYGTQFGQGAGSPGLQVATNGVSSIPGTYSTINALLTSAGFTIASSGGSPVVGTTGASGNSLVGQVAVTGTTAGSTYELIVVGINASAGASAFVSGGYTDIGWSNPFNYLTGTSLVDPNGQVVLSNSGLMNQFGVAPLSVPEPGTLALAALGGASMLMFRRKK